ncbi:MAG: SpvB/TcaC N-terminal domain-containing protein [Pseudomonadota bacterium]
MADQKNLAQRLSLPTGPGSIDGLGESYSVSPNTGTSQHTFSIDVPPGRAGHAPDLRIQYDSGYGNGLIGMGMRLNLPYVQRQTNKGLPNYQDWPNGDGRDNNANGHIDEWVEFDTYIDHLGNELVHVGDQRYRAEIESGFILYERLEDGWLWHLPNGNKMIFGNHSESRIESPDSSMSSPKHFRWYPETLTDTHGNQIRFVYKKLGSLDTQPYLKELTYNHQGEHYVGLRFDYEQRPDILTDYRSGFALTVTQRLTSISAITEQREGWRYVFDYEAISDYQPLSLLSRVQKISTDGQEVLPPYQLTWSRFDPDNRQIHKIEDAYNMPLSAEDTRFFDLNGDGLPDVVNTAGIADNYWMNLGPDESGKVAFGQGRFIGENSAPPLSNQDIVVADGDGDGISDILLLGVDKTTLNSPVEDVTDNSHALKNTLIRWQRKNDISHTGLNFSHPAMRFIDVNHDRRVDALVVTRGEQSVALNLAEGWGKVLPLPTNLELSYLDFASGRLFFADMNGDRLHDLVEVKLYGFNSQITYYPGRGLQGFGEPVHYDMIRDKPLQLEGIRFNDMNGDGRADFIFTDGIRVYVWLNKGLFHDETSLDRARFSPVLQLQSPITHGSVTNDLLDINANGSTDVFWYVPENPNEKYIYIELSPEVQPYQLTAIENGMGKQVIFEYGSLIEEALRDRNNQQTWERQVPVAMEVVKAVELTDGMSAIIQRTEYDYQQGLYNTSEHTFWGFLASEQRQLGDNDQTTLLLERHFLDGLEHKVLKGRESMIESRNGLNHLYNRVENTWQATEVARVAQEEKRQIKQAQLLKVKQYVTEGLPFNEAMITQKNYQYDNYGNTISIIESGLENFQEEKVFNDDQRRTQRRYTAEFQMGKQNWMVNLPVEEIHFDADDKRISHQQFFYDDESFSGTNLGDVSRGNLTLKRSWVYPEDNDKTIDVERRHFDRFGNVTDTYGPLWGKSPGHHIHSIYDSVYKTFEVERIRKIGASDERILKESATYDVLLGSMLTHIGYNGELSQYGYDGLGRLLWVVKPGDTLDLPTTRYAYYLGQMSNDAKWLNWIETYQREKFGQVGTLDSRTYFDGLGRQLMTRSEGAMSEQVVVSGQTVFDKRGFAIENFLPYYDKGMAYDATIGQAKEKITYDALGRPLRHYQPLVDKESEPRYQQKIYLPFVIKHQDEEQTFQASPHFGLFSLHRLDGLATEEAPGRLREVHQGVNEPTSSDNFWITRYDYDVLNHLTRVTDAQNNVRDMKYDALGRNYFTHDPNRGYQWKLYDDASNLIGLKDARGRVLLKNYDGANRLSQVFENLNQEERVFAGAETLTDFNIWADIIQYPQRDPNETYYYDHAIFSEQSSENLKGRLAAVEHEAGYKAMSYDKRGQLTKLYQRIGKLESLKTHNDAPEFTNHYQYDSVGRLDQRIYPDGTRLQYHYNTQGLLAKIPGVVNAIDYTASEKVKRIDYINGVSSFYEYDARQRVKRIEDKRHFDNISLRHLHYHFDGVNNLLAIVDKQIESSQKQIITELNIPYVEDDKAINLSGNFYYDSRYRLISAINDNQSSELYNYEYDRLGNLLQKTTHRNFLLTQDQSLLYGHSTRVNNQKSWNRRGRLPGESPGPHALTRIVDHKQSNIAEWIYDERGNVLQQDGYVYEWDDRQRLSMTKNDDYIIEYAYDESNHMKLKTTLASDGSFTSDYYIDESTEIKNGQLKNYVTFMGRKIAGIQSLENGSFKANVFFLHNHIGSTQLQIDEIGRVQSFYTYKPYGEVSQRLGDNMRTPYLFIGQEHDEKTGLDYLEQRHLKTNFARFLSPDPVFVLPERFNDPQHWSPYNYGRGNPLRFIDLNGESAGECPPDCNDSFLSKLFNSHNSIKLPGQTVSTEQFHQLAKQTSDIQLISTQTQQKCFIGECGKEKSFIEKSYTYGAYFQYKYNDLPGPQVFHHDVGNQTGSVVRYEYREYQFTEVYQDINGTLKHVDTRHEPGVYKYFGHSEWGASASMRHKHGSWVFLFHPTAKGSLFFYLSMMDNGAKLRPGAAPLKITSPTLDRVEKFYPPQR